MSKEVSTQVSGDIESFRKQCQVALQSKLLPQGIATVEQAMVIALKGKEIGIPMMQAFSHIHVISGKPAISAELMRSMIFRNCPSAQFHFVETSSKACVIEAARPGGKPSRFSFTIEDAQQAGLLSNPTWKKYPSAMLMARATSIAARAIFPDAIMGCSYTPEELGAEVAVTEDGSVVTVETTARIVADQPEGNDGHEDTSYRITFGKWARHTLEEVERKKPGELARYIGWLEASAEKTGKPLSEAALDFIKRAEEYLGHLENAGQEQEAR